MVSCIGPYQGQSMNLLRACVEKRIAYVDVADDRDFVARCHQMSSVVEEAGITAFVGCSVVPGMSSLLTSIASRKFPRLSGRGSSSAPALNIRGAPVLFSACFLPLEMNFRYQTPTANGRCAAGRGVNECVSRLPWEIGGSILSSISLTITSNRSISSVKTVEFKIGSELDVLNRMLSGLRQFKRALHFKKWNWLLPPSRALIYAASLFGTSQGGVMVEVSGRNHAQKNVA